MMSVLARRFADIKAGRPVQLFKSHREGIADGDQRRDFIYVDDVVRVMMWLLATPEVSGLFNVGTGKARSFKDMMLAAYAALGATPNIQYIDMPEQIRGSYQYFTQSEVDRLRGAGYNGGFTALGRRGRTLREGFPRSRRPFPLNGAEGNEYRCSISTPCRLRCPARRCSASATSCSTSSSMARCRGFRRKRRRRSSRRSAARPISAAPATSRATSPRSADAASSSA